jgi:hypothetical protein
VKPQAAGAARRLWLPLVAAGVLAVACGDTKSVVVPSLTATCVARPSSGTAPLPVNFTLDVSGAQGAMSVAINYGDGAAGTDPTAQHVYAAPGSYTATFTVTTPGQSALCSTAVRVDAPVAPSPSPIEPTVNLPPDPVFATAPDASAGGEFYDSIPFTIMFNMCRTTDPEHDPLRFTMDFEGDGITEVDGTTGADCRRSFTYEVKGIYRPKVCVTDLGSDRLPQHKFQCKVYEVTARP